MPEQTPQTPDSPPRDLLPSHQVTVPAGAGSAAGIVGSIIAVKLLGLVDPIQVGAVGALVAQLFGAIVSYISSGGRRGEI